VFATVTSGCATRVFNGVQVENGDFVDRVITQEDGAVRVSATVPTADEVIELIGLDLYGSDIQPVWLKVENNDTRPLRVALYSIDDEYFSPMEVAWAFRKRYTDDSRKEMERWFYENALPRMVPPGETRSGLVYTHRVEGTKGFNVDAHTSNASFQFTFFVPIPGFRPDYMDVRFADLYKEDEIVDVDLDEMRELIATYPCCSVNEAGTAQGLPFNVVIVGSPSALRRALLRSQWRETQSGSNDTAAARQNFYRGRYPDGVFYHARPDGSETKGLRIWMSPIRVDGQPVWLAQTGYDMSGIRFWRDRQIDPDIDAARMFALQSFWYGQSLAKFGMSTIMPSVSMDEHREDFLGNRWFSDGRRVVVVLSEVPIAMDETEFINWEDFLNTAEVPVETQ
jgi:hypothetical protein